MSLSSYRIAAQGFGFPLSEISIAIQGFIQELIDERAKKVIGGAGGGGSVQREKQREFDYEEELAAQLHKEDEMIILAVSKMIEQGVLA